MADKDQGKGGKFSMNRSNIIQKRPRTSNGTPRVAANTSNVRTSNGTPHVAANTSNVRTSNGSPHVAANTSNGTPHVATHFGTSRVRRESETSHVTPPASIIGVSSPCNSQPSFSNGEHNMETSGTAVASETQSNDSKPILFLEGKGFLPSHTAANGIGEILKSHFTRPWASWKKIPIKTRNEWFEEFKRNFSICPPDDWWARKNFDSRGAAITKNNLQKARAGGTLNKPSWLGESVWLELWDIWRTPKFKKKSIQGKTNRASDRGGLGASLHTCGSITSSQHRANMTKLNGTPPEPIDLFRRTHQYRKDNTWVDKKSEHTHEIFTHEWEKQTQAASLQGADPPSQMDVWRDVVGVNKNTMYGYGLHSTEVLRPSYQGSGSSSSEWVQRQELNEIRNELEEVRIERDQLRVEMANTMNTCEQNNKMIKKLMKMMKYQQPATNEELYDEDDEDGDEEESNSEGQIGEES